jgi:hypothetical protein
MRNGAGHKIGPGERGESMPADKSDFILKLSARLDETSEHLSRVEDDVLDVKRATHALANTVDRLSSTVDRLSSTVSGLGPAWRSMAGVVGAFAEQTEQRLDRIEAKLDPAR